jgi:hypothetical protein
MEWHGIFEVPETDHRVGGRLVIDEGESLLRLYGSLIPSEPGKLENEIPLVWGTAESGQQLTLVDLTSLGGSWLGSWPVVRLVVGPGFGRRWSRGR